MTDRRRSEPTRPNTLKRAQSRLMRSDLFGGLVSVLAEMAVVAFLFGLALLVAILVVWAL